MLRLMIVCIFALLATQYAIADEVAPQVAPQVLEIEQAPDMMQNPPADINFLPLPQVEQYSKINFITGGVGLEESMLIRQQYKQYALRLAFTEGKDAAYVVSVAVDVVNAKGMKVFEINDSGPLLYIDLPAGRYGLIANYKGKRKSQWVTIASGEHQRAFFNWKYVETDAVNALQPTIETNAVSSDASDLSIP